MAGLLHKARRYLFGYDAVESKNRRQAPTGRLRSEDKELLPHQRRKLTSASRDIHRTFTIAAWASPNAQYVVRTVMVYPRQIIRDLGIGSTAEYMLLDTAMEAYVLWFEMSALVRLSFKDGTTDLKAKTQARLAGMAQNYLRTYMDPMKALTDLKQRQGVTCSRSLAARHRVPAWRTGPRCRCPSPRP